MYNLLSKKELIRFQSVEQRNQYRDQKQKFLQKSGKSLQGKNNKWMNKCIIGSKKWPISALLNYIKDPVSGQSVTLVIPKTGNIVTGNKNMGQLYQTYEDPDDQMLYLYTMNSNSFG